MIHSEFNLIKVDIINWFKLNPRKKFYYGMDFEAELYLFSAKCIGKKFTDSQEAARAALIMSPFIERLNELSLIQHEFGTYFPIEEYEAKI